MWAPARICGGQACALPPPTPGGAHSRGTRRRWLPTSGSQGSTTGLSQRRSTRPAPSPRFPLVLKSSHQLPNTQRRAPPSQCPYPSARAPPLSLSLYTRWDPTCSHCGLKRKPWASNAKQSAATWPLHGVSIATGVFVLGRRPQTSVTLYFSK